MLFWAVFLGIYLNTKEKKIRVQQNIPGEFFMYWFCARGNLD